MTGERLAIKRDPTGLYQRAAESENFTCLLGFALTTTEHMCGEISGGKLPVTNLTKKLVSFLILDIKSHGNRYQFLHTNSLKERVHLEDLGVDERALK